MYHNNTLIFLEEAKDGAAAISVIYLSDQKCIYVVSVLYHHDAWLISTSFSFKANAGDCRAVLSCSGNPIPLSFDHKPSNYGISWAISCLLPALLTYFALLHVEEEQRIKAAGGMVSYLTEDARLNGICFG